MTFSEAVKSVLVEKYATFSGRASRSEYWFYALFTFIVVLALTIISLVIVFNTANPVSNILIIQLILGIWGLATFIPNLGVTVRRLHDTGKSGWFYFLCLIPFIGGIILLVFLIQDGNYGENKYGPRPEK